MNECLFCSDKFFEISIFFVKGVIKIFLMLFVFITLISLLRSYISREKFNVYLKDNRLRNYIVASLLGAVTPFCSCSSIPLFIGFIKSSIPLGVSFSFLITSPLVNEYLAGLMIGFFGVKVTVIYIINGILIGVVCGKLIDKLNLNNYIVSDISSGDNKSCNEGDLNQYSFVSRLKYAVDESIDMIKRAWLWIIISMLIGSFIHGFVPKTAVESVVTKAGVFDVPIAVFLGVPFYGSCASIVPIAYVLFTKGLPLGTALSFMMAVSALSLPEAILLSRVIKPRLITIFFSIVTIGIILVGYLFNFLAKFGL